ncbi:MAG: mechanosensitive ion channel domain-containing protein [Rhodanobacter sp.]
MNLFGIKFIGIDVENGHKLLLTVAFVVALLLLNWLLKRLANAVLNGRHRERVRFWTRQVIGLTTAVLVIIAVISIWVDNPAKLTTALGLVSAGLAFALQKVITSIAGYFVILRGKNFTVGDRISMGGVRGDVIGLGFIQTTIMEMGQPPAVQSADPAMWIKSRQFTGRIVSVANNKIFDEAIFNYTRNFPFIWEEIIIPITYAADRVRAERIMLEATGKHTLKLSEVSAEAVKKLQTDYYVEISDFEPRVFYRITDNWLELTVRFIVGDHKVRQIKDAISREMLTAFDAAGIGIASATYDIVGFPPVRVQTTQSHADT